MVRMRSRVQIPIAAPIPSQFLNCRPNGRFFDWRCEALTNGFSGGDYFLPLPCNGLFCATIELDTNQMTSFYFLAQIATSYKLDLSDLCPAKWLFEYQKGGAR